MALAIWEEQYGNDEEQEIPYAPVPQNIATMFPRRNEEDLCVVCRDGVRTHALIPCGHRVLCIGCVPRLERENCPLCNSHFTGTIRIW